MIRIRRFLPNTFNIGLTIFIVSCLPTTKHHKVLEVQEETVSNPLSYNFNETIRFGDVSEGHITKATDEAISEAESILKIIIEVKNEARTFDNTMLKIDDIRYVVDKVWSPAYLMGSTHPSEVIRNEGDSSSIHFEKFMNDLAVNEDLYNAVLAYSKTEEAKNLIGYRKKFLEDTLRDFRRSGFGLSKEKRDQVREIQNRLADIGLEFRRNISTYQDTLFITSKESSGLPEIFLKERLQEDGTYAIDMSYPSYFPIMKFAESNSVREKLSYKFLNRARDTNLDVLDEMIRLRRSLVEVLGYQTYATYRTEDRMAKDPGTVWQFEQDLQVSLKEKAELDYREMLEMKTQMKGDQATVIYPWEKWYYENQLLLAKYQVDEEEVKKYFEVSQVIEGLFEISQQLLNLEYREVKNPSVWHEDVRMFEVYNKIPDPGDQTRGEKIGCFYLDLFPRSNKYQHAAAFSIIMGKRLPQGYQKPAYALVCNFPKPSEEQPSLLPHSNVGTFFHEFGHLLHGILTKSDLISYAGTSVPRDFVEAPSQILENWIWNKESLYLFSRHYETGEVIPGELVDRMLSAKNLNSGTKALQQVFYGVLDFTIHDGYDPDGEWSTTYIVEKLQNEITPYPYQQDTHLQAAFSHLYGYAASYYGYMWAKVYAQDMFSLFEANGILDPNTGMRFRKMILEKGGTEDPLVMVEEFLGREPDNKAFLKSLGLTVSD